MKHRFTRLIATGILFSNLLTALLPILPVSATTNNYSVQNAPVNVARGEEAFMKSTYDFSANWIWNPSDNGAGNRWMIFRKDLTIDEQPDEVIARIAADTKYWLYINGELVVYEGGLKRGAALLNKDIYTKENPNQPDLQAMLSEVATYYDEVDLTSYFKEGNNTIVALVWYLGNEGHSHVGSGKGGFLFESQIGNQLIISDDSWKTARHLGYQPSQQIGGFAQEYHIVYDARHGYDHFMQPDFDVSDWKNAKILGKAGDKPWNELWKRSIPQWKVWELKTYSPDDSEYVTKLSATKYQLKLPSNIQFTPYVKVKAPAGKVIRMSSPNAGNTSVTYTTKGGEAGESIVQEFESLAWINWWFVEFEIPTDVEILSLGYRQSGYNTEFEGSFVSSDEFFNRLWIKARDTAYVNIRDTFMDCPDRERAPWLGDAVNEMGIAYYSMSPTVYDAVRKDIATRVNWQNADGIIPSTAPATFRYNEYAELSGQSLAGVTSWYDYYLWSGDIETIRLAYPALQRYIATFNLDMQNYSDPFLRGEGTNTMHLNWIDWGPNMDQHLSLNIWAYMGVDTLCKFATVLGDTENLPAYTALRDSMRSKFDAMFWNGKEFRSATYNGAPDDRGQALAVCAGLVTPDKYPIIRDLLMKHRYASPYTIKYVIEALYLMGYTKEAETRMKESYYADVMLDDPTFSESWGGGGSKNHGWSGGGLITLSGYAAGIRPLEAGFAKYTVIPQLSSIETLTATVPTAKGNITVRIVNDGDRFELTVNVLDGSRALIGIPRLNGPTRVVSGGQTLWENGYFVANRTGITFSHTDEHFIYFEATQGDVSLAALPAEAKDAPQYTLEIPEMVGGKLLVNGEAISLPYSGSFEKGSQIVLRAKANDGYIFDSFFGSVGSTEQEITLTMDRNYRIEASFVKAIAIEGAFLEVSGFSQGGTLYVNGKKAGGSYRDLFDIGATVTLKAVPSEDFRFVAWQDTTGKILSNNPEYTVTLEKNTKVVATFASLLGDNLAKGSKVTVSSTVDNHMFSANRLTDGIYTVTGQNEGWTSLETGATQWFYLDLGKVQTFDTVKLYPRHNGTDNGYGIPTHLEILISNDKTNWKRVAAYTNLPRLDSGAHTFTFDSVSARYVKINGSRLRANPHDGNRTRFQVAEVEIYHITPLQQDFPIVQRHPTSVAAQKGNTVRFTAEGISSATLSYQWYRSDDGGNTFTKMEGETQMTLSFPASLAESGCLYLCELTNSNGSTRTTPVSFTLVGENLALKRPSEVSSSQTVGSYFHQNYLNDGVSDTRPNQNEGWTSNENSGKPEWVTIDLGDLTTLTHVLLYPRYDGVNDGYGIPETITVLVSADGQQFTQVAKLTQIERPTEGALVISFETTEARYVKIVGERLRANPYDGNRKRMQLAEVEVYCAIYPDPAEPNENLPAPQAPAVTHPANSSSKGLLWSVIAATAALIAIGAGTVWFIRKHK